MDPPPVPSRSAMYCRQCYYDLRALPTHRCPECGRAFDPIDPSTYSNSPSPDRLKKFLKSLVDAGSGPAAPFGAVNRVTLLENKVRQLQAENEQLWDHFAWLLCQLMEKGIITEDDTRVYAQAAASKPPVVLSEEAEQLIQNLPIDESDPFFQLAEPEIGKEEGCSDSATGSGEGRE